MTDRVPGAPGRYRAAVMPEEFEKLQMGDTFAMMIQRDDQPIVEGTPYSKAAVLPDDLAKQICPNMEDPTPADALRALHEKIYPVGSVYISVLDTDPAQLFGGVWERLKDRFLLAAGETYGAGQVGGEATHKLTANEMPGHEHTVGIDHASFVAKWSNNIDTTNGTTQGLYLSNDFSAGNGYIRAENAGAGQAHNNMPPYLAVYMWKRLA